MRSGGAQRGGELRRWMPVRRGALPRHRRRQLRDALSLRELPARRRGAGRRVGDLSARLLRHHERRAGALPLVAAGGAELLRPLRHAAHVSARRVPRGGGCDDREPRRAGAFPAGGSHVGERAAALVAAGAALARVPEEPLRRRAHRRRRGDRRRSRVSRGVGPRARSRLLCGGARRARLRARGRADRRRAARALLEPRAPALDPPCARCRSAARPICARSPPPVLPGARSRGGGRGAREASRARLRGERAAPRIRSTTPDYYATFFSDPDGIRLEIVARKAKRDEIVATWGER